MLIADFFFFSISKTVTPAMHHQMKIAEIEMPFCSIAFKNHTLYLTHRPQKRAKQKNLKAQSSVHTLLIPSE